MEWADKTGYHRGVETREGDVPVGYAAEERLRVSLNAYPTGGA